MFPFKQLEEKYLSIPEDVQEAISSTKTNEKLLALTDQHKLQYDEAEELTKEIGYVMLGLKPKKDFIKNIQKATELNFDKARTIAEEINNTIFKDIRESLRQIHSNTDEEKEEDLNEELERKELLKEIENPTEKTADLIKIPEESREHENIKTQEQTDFALQNQNPSLPVRQEGLQKVKQNEVAQKESEIPTLTLNNEKDSLTTDQNTSPPKADEQSSQSTEITKPKEQKSYTIDPYREPID